MKRMYRQMHRINNFRTGYFGRGRRGRATIQADMRLDDRTILDIGRHRSQNCEDIEAHWRPIAVRPTA